MSVHREKQVRFTMQMPVDVHRTLKVRSAQSGISMHDFVMNALDREFQDIYEGEQAEGVKKECEQDGYVLFDDLKKELGL